MPSVAVQMQGRKAKIAVETKDQIARKSCDFLAKSELKIFSNQAALSRPFSPPFSPKISVPKPTKTVSKHSPKPGEIRFEFQVDAPPGFST